MPKAITVGKCDEPTIHPASLSTQTKIIEKIL